jgi:hypothetical protein
MLPRQDDYLKSILNVPLINHGQFNIDLIKSNPFSVLDYSTDPVQVLYTKSQLKSQGLLDRVLFLTGDCNLVEDQVVFLPTLMLHRSLEYSAYTFNDNLKRDYKISCLNRIPRGHKFYTYYKLLTKDSVILSFNGLTDSNSKEPISYDDPWYYNLPKKLKEQLKNVPRYKESFPEDNTWANDLTPNHPAFSNTYLNIVTETNSRSAFYSEKICKPLASNQFFLMSSGMGSLRGLRQLGVDCFDDVFDNHSYENLENFVDRIDAMISILDSLYPDLESIYADYFGRIKSNQEYFLSDSFRQKLISPLKEMGLLDK